MATVDSDSLQLVDFEERDGAILRMNRMCIVHDLANTNGDYRTLNEVNTALDSASLTFNSSPTGMTNLILKTRTARMVDTTIAEARLGYIAKGDSNLNWVWSGGSGVKQRQAIFDKDGILVTTTYDGETQVAPYDYPVPISTMTGTGILSRDQPWRTQFAWQGRVNSAVWAGAPAEKALVTQVNWDPVDLSTSPNKYLFSVQVEIDLNRDGQQPRATYRDVLTGRPPPLLIESFGSKVVPAYPQMDFNQVFPL